MYNDISQHKKKTYTIDTPGTHVYFLENRSGEITFRLTAEHAELYVFGLYTGHGKDAYTLSTVQHHQAPHTKSHILIKGAFGAHSSFAFDGIIRVDRHAQHTDALLENRNLLLSESTCVRTEPQLEIAPDQVRCTHAATVTTLSPETLTFLRARGLGARQARTLLTHGFTQDVLMQRDRAAL